MFRRSLLHTIGVGLLLGGLFMIASDLAQPEPVSFPPEPADGEFGWWGYGAAAVGLALEAFAIFSTFYFNLDTKRRADRAEEREIHDRRQRGDDLR